MILANTAQRIQTTRTELIYVLIDLSPSMLASDYWPTRKDGAVAANKRLIEAKSELFPKDRLGIITFAAKAELLHKAAALNTSRQSLCTALDTLEATGCGTNFVAALELAHACIFGSYKRDESPGLLGRIFQNLLADPLSDCEKPSQDAEHNSDITYRVILLTDGDHNQYGNPAQSAHRLKNKGVTIECIGIAGKCSEVNETLLKQIASEDERGNPRYCFIDDTAKLIRKYESMAGHIRPV